MHYNKCTLVKFDPTSMGQVISTLFKIRPIGGRLGNHSDQSEHVLRIFKLYLCLFQKNEISFLFFLSILLTKNYQSNYFLINNHMCESLQLNHELFW